MKVKPWQMILVVAGLVVGGGSTAYSLFTREPLDLPHRLNLIDVENGDLYTVDTTKYHLVMPAEHPQTKRICLVVVNRDESGKWFVNPRHRETLGLLDEGVKNAAVDPESGEILIPTKGPVKYVRTWKYDE